MRIFNKFRGTKGFVTAWNHMMRFRYMITEQAKKRIKMLAFWERHGTEAAKESFDTLERTLFRWQKALKANGGRLEALNPQYLASLKRRARTTPPKLESAIINIRKEHPRLGKDKIHAPLAPAGHHCSISTVGRILGYLKKSGRLSALVFFSFYAKTGNLIEKKAIKRKKKLRRP